MMFDTVEELQAHYKAVKQRIESKRPIPSKPVNNPQPEPKAKPLELVIKFSVMHRDIQRYEIKNNCLIKKLEPTPETASYASIVRWVCQQNGLTPRELFARRRTKSLVAARHLCWAMARALCPHMSLPQLGKHSFCYDHTSVLHGIERGRERAQPFIEAFRAGKLRLE